MHATEAELNDYLDDALDANDAQRVRVHVRECEACARATSELAALKADLARLPRAIAPERDLRPELWRRIDEAAVVDIDTARRGALWSLRYRLATAAVLLIVASSAVTLMIVRERSGGGFTPAASPDIRLTAVDSRALERQYSQEVHELELVLRKSRGALAPETVRILEENLRIIDGAIREAQAALATDHNSGMLIDVLRSAYERKLELLRQAARSSPAT